MIGKGTALAEFLGDATSIYLKCAHASDSERGGRFVAHRTESCSPLHQPLQRMLDLEHSYNGVTDRTKSRRSARFLIGTSAFIRYGKDGRSRGSSVFPQWKAKG